jgi:hypothetical protein
LLLMNICSKGNIAICLIKGKYDQWSNKMISGFDSLKSASGGIQSHF